jgi:hypothetical protein
LSRGTYKLPHGKAEALATFLREHLTDDVDVKVEGDSLIVTATPEVQASITEFVTLFQNRSEKASPAKSSSNSRSGRFGWTFSSFDLGGK